MSNKRYAVHPRNYGKDSRACRVCHSKRGVIQKYGMNVCRKCFKENTEIMGFKKYI